MIKILFSIHPKMRIRNFTKMGEGLQCCRSSPEEDLQWKGEDLQCCKPSPLGHLGLQCCRSSGRRQIFRGGLQCCRPSGGGLQGGRSAIQHRHSSPLCYNCKVTDKCIHTKYVFEPVNNDVYGICNLQTRCVRSTHARDTLSKFCGRQA